MTFVRKGGSMIELRMASIPKTKRTATAIGTLVLEDVKEFKTEEPRRGTGPGFKYGKRLFKSSYCRFYRTIADIKVKIGK